MYGGTGRYREIPRLPGVLCGLLRVGNLPHISRTSPHISAISPPPGVLCALLRVGFWRANPRYSEQVDPSLDPYPAP